MTCTEKLEKLGWKYESDLLQWTNSDQRYFDLSDYPYIDIFCWNGEEKTSTYLTAVEYGLFYSFIKHEFILPKENE